MQVTYTTQRSLKRFFLLFTGLFVFLYFFNPIETEDVWWHLSTGRWIIEHWQLPHVDIFPFANETTPWSCHNEWLGSVILYSVVKLFGLLGLKVFRSLFFILAVGILFRYAYKRLPFSLLIIFSLLVIFGISGRSFLKPDVFNIFFIQLFLINLFNYEDSGCRRYLCVLPILICLWFNIHLGGFVYGMSLLSIFILSAGIQRLQLNFRQSNSIEKIDANRKVKHLALIILICLASFILNPYGIEGFLYPFKVFLIPDYIGFYKFASTIQENLSPWYIFKSFSYFYYFVLFVLASGVLFLNKKNNLTLIILLTFSSIAFLCVGRNSVFFTIVCAYVFIVGIKDMKFNEFWQRLPFLRVIEYVLYLGIAFFLVIQISSIWSKESYFNRQVLNNRFLESNPYSKDVIELLIRNNITGPVFNSDSLGGQMLWLGYPSLRPFRDGRNNSYERCNDALVAMSFPKENWLSLEKRYNIKIVVLRPDISLERNVLNYLSTQSAWQLIAVNGTLAVYVKRGEFILPKELDGFEGFLKSHKYFTVNDLHTLKALKKERHVSRIQQILFPSADNVVYSDFFSLYLLGYQGAAVQDVIEALKVGDRPEVHNAANFILKQFPDIK
ncbi:MAG: hypothetical protein HQL15_07275 [Candidatus Omnitrophica bacterium]|nr:hypothetical protein [Candidatus Omnitrophota bacterium]